MNLLEQTKSCLLHGLNNSSGESDKDFSKRFYICCLMGNFISFEPFDCCVCVGKTTTHDYTQCQVPLRSGDWLWWPVFSKACNHPTWEIAFKKARRLLRLDVFCPTHHPSYLTRSVTTLAILCYPQVFVRNAACAKIQVSELISFFLPHSPSSAS